MTMPSNDDGMRLSGKDTHGITRVILRRPEVQILQGLWDNPLPPFEMIEAWLQEGKEL